MQTPDAVPYLLAQTETGPPAPETNTSGGVIPQVVGATGAVVLLLLFVLAARKLFRRKPVEEQKKAEEKALPPPEEFKVQLPPSEAEALKLRQAEDAHREAEALAQKRRE